MIVVPTIPGTGTHFMRDHLLADHHTYVRHIFQVEIQGILDRMAEHPAIVPMRRRDAVLETWRKQGRETALFNGWAIDKWFAVMDAVIMPLEPYVLHIDQPEIRDDELATINADLGLALATDWPVIRQQQL